MAALVVLAILPSIDAVGAADDGYVGIRALPENEAATSETGLYVRVESGSTVTRHVAVSNTTGTPLTISLSAGAADVRDGDFRFSEPGEQNEASGWARFDPDHLTVEPGEERVVTVRFVVPTGAADGVRYAVVWAQPPAADGGGVQVVNRVGVRVAISVGTLASTGTELATLIGIAAVALLVGAVLVLSARRAGGRSSARQVERRRSPWPKKPPLGRAWA